MSQHDYIISDDSGLAVLADLNNAFQALVGENWGSAAPATLYAKMRWVDTSSTPWLLKRYDGADWIVEGSIDPTSNTYTPFYNGSPIQDTFAALAYVNGAAPAGLVSKLILKNNSGTPNTKIDITADSVALTDGASFMTVRQMNKTIDCGAVGANGLDSGTLAGSTWYYFWVIAKPDGTAAALASASSSTPSMPPGYTFKRLAGMMSTDGSAHFRVFRQFGDEVFFAPAGIGVVSGGAQVSWAPVNMSSLIPAAAVSAKVHVAANSTSGARTAHISADGTNEYFSLGACYNQVRGYAQIEVPMLTSSTMWYRSEADLTVDVVALGFRVLL